MLDSDLADMYQVETKYLKRQVNRNIDRFPIKFMFQLTKDEYKILRYQNGPIKQDELQNLRSQIGTSSWGGTRYLPYAFTEHGILMLSSVLNSKSAIQVNITLMKLFVKLREAILTHKDIFIKLEKIDKKIIQLGMEIKNQDGEIETLFELVDEIRKESNALKKSKQQRIGFKITPSKK